MLCSFGLQKCSTTLITLSEKLGQPQSWILNIRIFRPRPPGIHHELFKDEDIDKNNILNISYKKLVKSWYIS